MNWSKTVGYQIFPASFYDSNVDGFGDIKGIESKLDYLSSIGINMIWMTPIYKTKFIDAGYDVDDYYNIYEKFGTLEQVKDLIIQANLKKIKVMMDMVLNHTSSNHLWFLDCLANGKKSKYWNFYIWSEKQNNSKSIFGGSAWKYVEEHKMYYYHLFSESQPDLNWDNAEMRKELYRTVKFWIKLGIKGFRMDAIEHIGKDVNKDIVRYGPKCFVYMKEMHDKCFKNKKDVFVIGESWNVDLDKLEILTSKKSKSLNAFFSFAFLPIGWGKNGRGEISTHTTKQFVENNITWQNDKVDPGTISNFLTSHDSSRALSRWGSDKFQEMSAKCLATLQFFLKGIPFIYYGEEIGMVNPIFEKPEEFRDIDFFNNYNEWKRLNPTKDDKEFIKGFSHNGRDSSRTPMQWTSTSNAGFSSSEPWIKLSRNYRNINVENNSNNKDSILNYYRSLIEIRLNGKHSKTIIEGNTNFIDKGNRDIISFTRTSKNEQILVLLNMSDKQADYETPIHDEVVINNYGKIINNKLEPWQAIVVKIK
jgi:oligo-1,6-glucosidase